MCEHPRIIEGHGKLGLIVEYINALFWETILSLRLFIRHRFHAVHGANPPDHLFLVASLFKAFGVKYIFDHHDIAPENFVAKFGKKGLLFVALKWMEWLNFRFADIVIATNESYKAIACGRGGLAPCKVFVVRNGPEMGMLRGEVRAPELRSGFRYQVGYVGVIGQQEGIENLLEAVEYIVGTLRREDIVFYVVGTGPHWRELVALCSERKLGRFIRFTGYVSDEELWRILGSSDVCINPEFRNEFTDRSTMIKVMEYMALGRPTLQFHTLEGEVTAGESGVYVQENSCEAFGKALVDLLDDEKRRKQLGQIALERVEKVIGWKHQKEHLEKAYAAAFSQR